MSTPPPRHSLSLPTTTSENNERVFPTPSPSSTTFRHSPYHNRQPMEQRELEQQLADKKKQLQESTSGIGRNVLVRQIDLLEEKIKELQTQKNDVPVQTRLTSEKLKGFERDLADYRKPPSLRNKKEQQRTSMTTGLDLLPSPTASSLLPPQHDSTSLLPSAPPLTGSTPTKRRSKVPNTDRRNPDIEFATEIGQGLLLEVRKMQALLQDKEEQLRTLEIQKADLERAAEAMAKQMRQREENEEKLKEETWNLELAKQELTVSVTELQQNLNKANVEQTKLAKQADELRTEIEQLRASEEKLHNKVESMKSRHEQDMSSMRHHASTLQKEKLDQAKQIENLTSELAIVKAQTRISKPSVPEAQPSTRSDQLSPNDEGASISKDNTLPSSLRPPSPVQLPVRNPAMEVETLKSSLAHAHRMVSTLRSNLHKEKAEKFEFKKLLAESQETIENMENDPRLWIDARSGPREHPKRSLKTPKRRGKKTESSSKRTKPSNTSLPLVEFADLTDSSSFTSDIGEDDNEETVSSPIEIEHMGFTSLSSELSQGRAFQRHVGIDVEVNTDPVRIEQATQHFGESPNEAAQLDDSAQNSLKQTLGGAVAGAAGAAAVAASLKKEESEVSTQTDLPKDEKETSTQTDATLTVTFSTQTESLDLAVHTSIQTEAKPEGVENFAQTATKSFTDVSAQTDLNVQGVETSVQTESKEPQNNLKNEAVGSVGSEAVAASILADKLTGNTFTSSMVDSSVQTVNRNETSKPLDMSPHRSGPGENSNFPLQENGNHANSFITSSKFTERENELTNQRPVQSDDKEVQTRLVETKDAQIQCDAEITKDSSVLPAPLLGASKLLEKSESEIFSTPASEIEPSLLPDKKSSAFATKVQKKSNGVENPTNVGEMQSNESAEIGLKPISSKPLSISSLEKLAGIKSNIEDDSEKKVFSKKETDALITTAISIALARARKNPEELKSNRDSAMVNSSENICQSRAKEENNDFGSVVVHIPQDQALDIQAEKVVSSKLIDGPSSAFEQKPESSDNIENAIPERPTSPPPSSLLSRALSPKRMSKGKMSELEADHQRSLNRTPVSMSSMSTANTHDQLHSATSSHLENRSIGATDPQMISLITKTMIGDWLWKNTRKTVGGGISGHMHQRYFWIHPYSRTLYWSNKSPGLDGRHAKAKSALIENITVVPNKSSKIERLPDVSLLIQTTHRQLMLTAPNMEQHDNWLEAISHLVSRNTESNVQSSNSRNTNTRSTVSSTGNSLLQKASLRRLHDKFYQPSVSTTSATHRTESTNHDHEDDPLEDVRMCCDGKHHVSKLEKAHKHRRQYRKHSSHIPHNR
ncbi:hypothetical protein BY458DRAFT_532066 [Sporodiniella umbellata]|nr:hypothetical protein BY458DRAFT_532066 [Sporodiniella umbellata]